ncbi:RIM101 (YHL027W) [Zygosaccharomyces parabailii]|nr:RIM101 (YHL027W) [Zygosaccharomyces parabailii]CDH12112.1 uncharacterized protein ZBAI_03898 [Zygosaccharomyces bailii ISA1307]
MVFLKDILNHDAAEPTTSPQNSDVTHKQQRSASFPSPNFSTSSSYGGSIGNSDSDDDGTKCRLAAPSSSHVETPQSGTPSSMEEEQFYCKWDQCDRMFNQPEFLYHHLCQDHVGRKSQRNLQLACKWKDCNVKTEKRDHITSHLRVHVPLKPFDCSKCGKKFKRPQDLKKHLKVHVESHVVDKKKRGPKVGSKRIQKKSKSETESTRSRLSSTSSSVSSPSPTPDRQYPFQQTTLPRITFQQLISNELSSYEPVYTKQLGSKLQTVLPALREEETLPRTPSVATQNAAGFFTTLSKNMSSSQQTQSSVTKQSITQPLTASYQAGYKRPSYPEICQLPPIGPPTNATRERSSIAMLPSLNSVPVLNPRHGTFERLPHFNAPGQYFSSHQKSNGNIDEDELVEQFVDLQLKESCETQDVLNALEIVNIIRDYLICSLLEQDYDDEEEAEEEKHENKDDVLIYETIHSKRLTNYPSQSLSRYPHVVI